MIADQHLHLERGPYTPEDYPVAWLERYLETASLRGVDWLGIVEHGYRFREAAGLLPGAWAEARCLYALEPYLAFVERVKALGLPVSFGIEMDWVEGAADGIRRFVALYPWDFVLGSVHVVDGLGVDLAEDRPQLRFLGMENVWRRYFALSRQAVRSGLFDVLTHPDLPKIFGDPLPGPLDEEYRRTAEALAQAGMAIECNTAGLRRPVGAIYPHPAYLAAAAAAGVPVSLGSDAHEPENVGQDFPAALALLRETGHSETVHFIARRRIASPL